MKERLASLILAFLACWPLVSFADQDLQARFEKSLKDVKSISNVEIDWLDTLWVNDPEALKSLNVKVFSRTFQYSYLMSGMKYRASCKLISGTQTNIAHSFESAFDGTTYSSYSGDNRYMIKSNMNSQSDASQSLYNPLVAPFMFLTRSSKGCESCFLRFTDIVSAALTNGLVMPVGQISDGLLEISLPGLSVGNQPITWKVIFDKTANAFTPQTIKYISPGGKSEFIARLLNYTNLGAYQFPARIEWAVSLYPPTSPPTLLETGTVTVISARIPDQIADSVFNLDSEEKVAAVVWDWDQKNFIKSAHENSNSSASLQARPNIYDESADGSKQIADALDIAKKEHKHILLQFGANWCGWCHKLHKLFETDKSIAEVLKSDYVVVMIDVNKGHNNDTDTKYGHPTRFGLPAIVVLDADGKQLITQDTGKLAEGDHHSPDKVMAFLKEWAPKK